MKPMKSSITDAGIRSFTEDEFRFTALTEKRTGSLDPFRQGLGAGEQEPDKRSAGAFMYG